MILARMMSSSDLNDTWDHETYYCKTPKQVYEEISKEWKIDYSLLNK